MDIVVPAGQRVELYAASWLNGGTHGVIFHDVTAFGELEDVA